MQRVRIEWLDDLKGFAIVLIVLGHVVATLGNMAPCATISCLYSRLFKAIYLFHVPLFFVLAGVTYSCKGSFCEFAWGRFKRLMIPYFVWGFCSAVLYIIMGQGVASEIQAVSTTSSFASKTVHGDWWVPLVSILHGGNWPHWKGFCFNGVLWFLPVLFMVELVYWPIARYCKKNSDILLAFMLAIVLLVYENPLIYGLMIPYGLTWVPKFLPFIAFGHWLALVVLHRGESEGKGSAFGYLCCGMVAMYILLCWLFPSLGLGEVRRYIFRTLSPIPIILLLMILARFRVFHWLSFLSAHTIGIMLFHKFPLVVLQVIVGRWFKGIMGDLWCSLMLCASMTIVLVVACYFVSVLIARYAPWSLGRR